MFGVRTIKKPDAAPEPVVRPLAPAAPRAPEAPPPPVVTEPSFLDLKVRLHQQLLGEINLSVIERMSREQFMGEVGNIIRELLTKESTPLNERERTQLVADVLDEILGLGPLEPLLKDDCIADILVNTHAQVYVERHGQLEATPVQFKDEQHLLRVINKMVTAVGRHIDEAHPLVDARLADGSRINAVVAPIAVDGPLLSIRKFAKVPMDLDRLMRYGALTPKIKELIEAMVKARLSILVSGGTGSGKTSMLNAMSQAIDSRERIVTIEDAAELQLQKPHVARMETRPPNAEGKGEITQRDLIKNALRMRPDRIILGEVRAGEAFDMLQAMNTGHDGSMSTIHANTPRDAISRLEQMIGMAGLEMSPRTVKMQIASAVHVVIQLSRLETLVLMAGMELPVRAIRQQISSAIDLVVQLSRLRDGSRRVTASTEIVGMEGETISMQDIYTFEAQGSDANGRVTGRFAPTGVRPQLMNRLNEMGLPVPA
ncbi:MAG TPA: CpaF family protein, partial [Stellaceae bacterium]|nr:CpaF family protein [Stellaceae bacterium]